jgi:hypothetical protein
LDDLIETSPGQEGKWFATAKELGMLDLALELARKGPCDPKTLTRAANDYLEENPEFAMNVGMAALAWLLKGYGYEISGLDVWAAYHATMKAAEAAGNADEVRSKITQAVKFGLTERNAIAGILARELGLK